MLVWPSINLFCSSRIIEPEGSYIYFTNMDFMYGIFKHIRL
jgi:hypothetical protein